MVRRPALALFVLFLPGCVSIATHEERLKEYRGYKAQVIQVQEENARLKHQNGELRRDLSQLADERNTLFERAHREEGSVNRVRGAYDDLINELKDQIAEGHVTIQPAGERVTVTLDNKILFRSGSADLSQQGRAVLSKVAAILKYSKDDDILIQGHADNVPLSKSLRTRFPSNWELAAYRAGSVIRYLQTRGKIRPERMILSSFGEFRPLKKNDSRRNRAKNRRVEISFVPPSGRDPHKEE